MADDSTEIKKLVKLRKQRPAFSRMISWEISEAAGQKPVKKLKQKKKKTFSHSTEVADTNTDEKGQNTGDIDSESCESSEYETACEDEGEMVEMISITDGESQYESIGADLIDSVSGLDFDEDGDDVDDDEFDEEDDPFMSSMGSDTVPGQSCGEVQQGRRRRLSKKQKRKRKKYFRVMYVDDLYNLGNLFDTTDEINDVVTEVLASGPDVEIRRRVPTLVELCMKVNRRKQRSNSEKGKNTSTSETEKGTVSQPVLPPGMKKLMSSWGWSQKQLESQLSFFLNKVLPIVEDKMKQKFYVCADLKWDNAGEIKTPKPTLPRRSVWTVLPYPPVKNMLENMVYVSEKTPVFLFTPSFHYQQEAQNIHYMYLEYYNHVNVCLTDCMYALATTIDLMLPGQTQAASATTAIIRVKRALSLRYKNLVDILFEKVLPYVMWARGKVAIATDMFRNLVEKEKEADVKAMYLSEIARMHAMFGDCKAAEQFYRLATETASEDLHTERRDRCINEVSEQKQVLLASVCDTGVLNEEKAVQSYTYWTGVKNIPTVRNSTLMAGFDALLCYHLSRCTGTSSKLYDEAISKLEKMTKACSFAYYYQALLYALQGSLDISTRLYRECRSSCFHTPGDDVLQCLGRKVRNPWQPLIDLVNSQTLVVKPLPVVWRTNLQPPRLTKESPMEAQINSLRLNLRLNEAGHVTGDMQMMLPPIRDISLDPYTGSLVLDNLPSHTGMWTSACLYSNRNHCTDLLVPTPRLIYSGEDGTTVEMVKLCNTSCSIREKPHYQSNGPPCPFVLIWRNPDGHVAKLSLNPLLRNHVKEKLKKTFESGSSTFTKNYTEDDFKVLYQLLDIACEKGLPLYEQIFSSAMHYYKKDAKKEKKKKEKVQAKRRKRSLFSYLVSASNKYYTCWELSAEPLIFGKTIVLQLNGTYGGGKVVFVNTENKKSFLSCNITSDYGDALLFSQGRDNCTDEEFLVTVRSRDMVVLNGIGEVVLSVEVSDLAWVAREGCPPIIIYPKIFGVNFEKNSIWCAVIGLEDIVCDIEDKICWTIGSVYDELTQGTDEKPVVKSLSYVGKNVNSTGKLLMVNLVTGLAFIDPNTMEFVTINVKDGCAKHFEFTTGNSVIKGDFEKVEILAEKNFTVDEKYVYRVAFGVQNKAFVLDLTKKFGDSEINLELIYSVELPGFVKEICLVGKQVGLLISLSQHREEGDEYYREHVFYFDFDGQLNGVLLCLGHGPRSFLPVYLHGNQESEGQGESTAKAGWYVYLRDGRDGILCICLHE